MKKESNSGMVGLLILIIAALWFIWGPFSATKEQRSSRTETAPVIPPPTASRPSPPLPAKLPEKAIPGIMPVDVYLNMEKRGYTTNKDLGGDRCVWMCSKRINLTAYGVEAYGSNASTVRRINVSVGTTIDKSADAIALSDFMYVASLPYDGSDPERAQNWVKENMGQSAKTTIGGVTFELDASNQNGRWLSMYVSE